MTRVTQTGSAHGPSASTADGVYVCVSVEGQRPWARGARYELTPQAEVIVGSGDVRRMTRSRSWRLDVADSRVSREHCRIWQRFGQWSVADLDSKNGTFVNGVRQRQVPLNDGDVIRVGTCALVFRSHGAAGHGDLDLEHATSLPGITTLAPELDALFRRAAAVAAADVPVLIAGATGAGKELLALALHTGLGRPGAFVPVNCGGLPKELVESELFGHRRGAFSGSHEDRAGLFAQAHRGTLFLDELGELPLAGQASLLRAVQDRSVRAVGGTAATPVDLRLISATNRDLSAMVAQQQFRADLHGRMAGFVIELPPITARREDFGGFIAHALEGRGADLQLSAGALDQLMLHPWPGGARSLAHALHAGVALRDGDATIREIPLPPESDATAHREANVSGLSPREQELRQELKALSEACGGNLAEVARRMGKDRKQIRRWVERFGLGEDVLCHRDG